MVCPGCSRSFAPEEVRDLIKKRARGRACRWPRAESGPPVAGDTLEARSTSRET